MEWRLRRPVLVCLYWHMSTWHTNCSLERMSAAFCSKVEGCDGLRGRLKSGTRMQNPAVQLPSCHSPVAMVRWRAPPYGCCHLILTRVLHAVPLSYYTADPNDVAPRHAGKDDDVGLWEGNDNEDNDDENEDDDGDDDEDDDSVQEVPGSPPTTPQARRRRQPATPPPATPSPRTPRRSAARPKQHDPPAGIYVGTWKGSGLSARRVALGLVNTVYMSVDKRGFVRRRITKWDRHGEEVMESNWDGSSISCPHEDIKYVRRFKGMSKDQVDEEVRGIHARAQARQDQAAL